MNFNSIEFFIFFIFALLVFAGTMGRNTPRNIFLLILSYIFYASWDWRYLGLILGSTTVGYLFCLGMDKANGKWRFWLLTMVVGTHLGVLGLFKYFNFFADSSNIVLKVLGLNASLPYQHLLLPIGISFYTLRAIGYTIDLYRKDIPVEKSFINYAAFIAFFPQLLAGPIARASNFLPQLNRLSQLEKEKALIGLTLVFKGLFKKILIADMIASFGVDAVFEAPGSWSTLSLWFALYGYAIQIYYDFSGYSDIANGITHMIGFEGIQNFNRPYQSSTPSEFWGRWHISLSKWLRDYLYIPLGGNRKGQWRTCENLMITMLLCGLWHGASWHFILWGIYHGALLVISRFTWPFKNSKSRYGRIGGVLITFHLVCIGWLLFRAPNMEILGSYFFGLFSFQVGAMVSIYFMIVLMIGLLGHFLSQGWLESIHVRFIRRPIFIQAVVYYVLLMVFVGASQQNPAFIYFQF